MTKMVDEWTDEEFCREFWASLDEFYGRWKEASGGSLRDFEAAFERGKKNGILPHPFFAKPDSIRAIFKKVLEERARQDEEWGGADHDDEHDAEDWYGFIEKQIALGRHLDTATSPGKHRSAMVKIAALAVAALQSMNRTTEQKT